MHVYEWMASSDLFVFGLGHMDKGLCLVDCSMIVLLLSQCYLTKSMMHMLPELVSKPPCARVGFDNHHLPQNDWQQAASWLESRKTRAVCF